MQQAEIGHFSLTINDIVFNLVPSFKAIAKIADSVRILRLYDMIHSPQIPSWLKLEIARDTLLACSDKASINDYLVKVRKQKPHLNSKCISMSDQITVAAALLRHGVAGVNRPKYAGDNKAKGKAIDAFDVNAIVAQAMIHFGLSKSEAENLTMSEFCQLLSAKFPPDSEKQETPSLEAHKEAMKALMEKNK